MTKFNVIFNINTCVIEDFVILSNFFLYDFFFLLSLWVFLFNVDLCGSSHCLIIRPYTANHMPFNWDHCCFS